MIVVKTNEAAMKAATLATEEAKAEEVMERLRAVERAFGLRARGRAVGGEERGAPKGEREVEGESKCYHVQGHGVQLCQGFHGKRGAPDRLPVARTSPTLSHSLPKVSPHT